MSFWWWLTSVSDMILKLWVSIKALAVSRWTIASFISSWRCNTMSDRLMDGLWLERIGASIPLWHSWCGRGGAIRMGCDIGHTCLWRLMWGWNVSPGSGGTSPLLAAGLLGAVSGGLLRRYLWRVLLHCKNRAQQEVLYSSVLLGLVALSLGHSNRVQGRDWHLMTIEEWLSENHPEWFWDELSAIEWPCQWILLPNW